MYGPQKSAGYCSTKHRCRGEHCRAAHTGFMPGLRAAWAFEVIQIAALVCVDAW
jgi:hypothetical protein